MSYHAPETVTLKARHGREAYRGLRVRPLGGLGQADMTFTLEEVDAYRRPPAPTGTAPTGTKTGGATAPPVPTGGKTAPASVTPGPLLPYAPMTQTSTDWTPWVIGGGVALVALLGLGWAASR